MPTNPATPPVIEQLRAYDEAYYNSGSSPLTDPQYDDLRKAARDEFPDHPYFATVGAAPAHLTKTKLTMHMGSQQKVTTRKEFLAWYELVTRETMTSELPGEVLVMEKLDGLSVEVTYKHGRMVRAVTRGDGEVGSDITANARRWGNLPVRLSAPVSSMAPFLPPILVVRGEAMLPIAAWVRHFTNMKNPRNAAAGTVTREDGSRNEHIMFTAFDCVALDVDGNEMPLTAQARIDASLLLMADYGLSVVPCQSATSVEQLERVFASYVATRPGMGYQIDGLILSAPCVEHVRALGFTNGGTCPVGQAAWKFEAEQAESVVISVDYTLGHTGALIPTATLEPVDIGGVTITHALLNNFCHIEDLNLNIGDTVLISRRGDVIPKIEKVVSKGPNAGSLPRPLACPFCHSTLATEGRALLCINDGCDGRSFQLIRNWVKKLDMLQFGEVLLQALYDSGMVRSIPDLYDLHEDDLASTVVGNGVFGHSMAMKVMAEIDRTRHIPANLFMGSLGIKFLGRRMAAHIGLAHPKDYLDIPVAELATKENMGANKAALMKDSIAARWPVIARLLMKVEVAREAPKVVAASGGRLSGMVMVFTGCRPTKDEQALFESLGGVIKETVSDKISHLVQKKADSESSKSKKAKDLGKQVIGYLDFQRLIA